MATPEQLAALQALLVAAGDDLPEVTWTGTGDLGRMSIEAIVVQGGEDLREVGSFGQVRLGGAGVQANTADLDDVGLVATLWQRCVTTVGASLEGFRSTVGRVPDVVAARTKLRLQAAPAMGSIVLAVSPRSDAMDEAAPGGARRMFDVPRPLADRATEAFIQLLASASNVGPNADELGIQFKTLGPRAATSIKALAEVLDRAHIDLDVAWSEPDTPTRRATVTAGTAGWLHEFVAGRALDGIEEEIRGLVRTVSDVAKWQVEVDSSLVPVDASALDSEIVRRVHVGQNVRLVVFTRSTERPDGTVSTTREAVDLLSDA